MRRGGVLERVAREGETSILIVEQNVYLALSVTNRGYVMESGQIVLEGTSQELLSNEMVQRVYLGMEEVCEADSQEKQGM